NVVWYYNTRLNWSGSNQKNTSATLKRCRNTTFGRVQKKKRKVTESIISRQTSTSRSRSSTRKALMSLKLAQNTLNQNKVLDEILRKFQNIEEKQGTYVASLVYNTKTKNASHLISPQVNNDQFLKVGCHNISRLKSNPFKSVIISEWA
ncbi:40461_t:CDS:2, partial [Gigaspora margarita]